jgi:uncharacterized membrane protein YphA (DoxX/SURF4 family)
MQFIKSLVGAQNSLVNAVRGLDGLPLLLLRIYLAPIFIQAGYGKLRLGDESASMFEKLAADPNVVAWFGNPDWGLGLPAPELMGALAGWTEFLGGWLLLFGLFTRFIAVPLMFTMIVAATTAHWEQGWHALPEAKLTVPWEWREDLIETGLDRKDKAVSLLKEHGNYSWLTEGGSFTVLKNGIEFAATYFVMLFVLFFFGAGRYVGLDHYLTPKRPGESFA